MVGVERAFPGLAGSMDAYGEYEEAGKPRRVAITPYFRYDALSDVVNSLGPGADAWKLLGPLTKAGP